MLLPLPPYIHTCRPTDLHLHIYLHAYMLASLQPAFGGWTGGVFRPVSVCSTLGRIGGRHDGLFCFLVRRLMGKLAPGINLSGRKRDLPQISNKIKRDLQNTNKVLSM